METRRTRRVEPPLAKFTATGRPLPKIQSIDAHEMYLRGLFGAMISQYGVSGRGSFKELWHIYQRLFHVWYPDEVCP